MIFIVSLIIFVALNKPIRVMNDELEEIDIEIQRLKKKLSDYLKFIKIFEEHPEKTEIQINIMLDDLHKLLEKRKTIEGDEY